MEDTAGLIWKKASKSGNGGECVELAFTPDGHVVGMVRDSKSPERGHLRVRPDAFAEFLTSVKRGELDMPTRLEHGRL
jgi:Domain of unknown function (DUF397)